MQFSALTVSAQGVGGRWSSGRVCRRPGRGPTSTQPALCTGIGGPSLPMHRRIRPGQCEVVRGARARRLKGGAERLRRPRRPRMPAHPHGWNPARRPRSPCRADSTNAAVAGRPRRRPLPRWSRRAATGGRLRGRAAGQTPRRGRIGEDIATGRIKRRRGNRVLGANVWSGAGAPHIATPSARAARAYPGAVEAPDGNAASARRAQRARPCERLRGAQGRDAPEQRARRRARRAPRALAHNSRASRSRARSCNICAGAVPTPGRFPTTDQLLPQWPRLFAGGQQAASTWRPVVGGQSLAASGWRPAAGDQQHAARAQRADATAGPFALRAADAPALGAARSTAGELMQTLQRSSRDGALHQLRARPGGEGLGVGLRRHGADAPHTREVALEPCQVGGASYGAKLRQIRRDASGFSARYPGERLPGKFPMGHWATSAGLQESSGEFSASSRMLVKKAKVEVGPCNSTDVWCCFASFAKLSEILELAENAPQNSWRPAEVSPTPLGNFQGDSEHPAGNFLPSTVARIP